jgi:hypothetical protein
MYERIAVASGLIKRVDFGAITGGAGAITPPEVGADVSFGAATMRKGEKGASRTGLGVSDDIARRELELQRHLGEQLALERGKRYAALEQDQTRQQQLIDERLQTLREQIERELQIYRQAFAAGAIDQAEFEAKKRDLFNRRLEAEHKHSEDTAKLIRDTQKAQLEERLRFLKDREAMDKAADEGKLARIKAAADRGEIAESEAIRRELEFLTAAHKTRLEIIDEEINASVTLAARKLELNVEKRIAETEYTDAFKKLTQDRIDAMLAEQAKAIELGPAREEPGVLVPDMPVPPPPNFDPWLEAFSQVKAMGLDAMHSLAQGIGDMVQNWVLLGTAGPNAVRKMVAGVLGALAAQAAVEALMELAKGFAALANPFMAWTAPLHFKAAAMFGLVAGGAAIAGRLIAGDAFKGASGGGGSGGGNGGGGSSPAAKKDLAPQDFDRKTFNVGPQTVHHELVFKVKGDAVVDAFVQDYDLNGKTRIKILTDGQG